MINQKNIFIIGIKGIAMANIALILKKMGKTVAGSDIAEDFISDIILKENNINCKIGFSPQDIPENTDLVIYAASHQGINNAQVIAARIKGITVLSQAEVINKIMEEFQHKIAVCGCHGKTTTASLLAYCLKQLGVNPSYLVGATSFNNLSGADYLDKKYFVVEADEYGVNPPLDKTPKFYHLNPDFIICTNIDFDHPDVYKNIEEVKKAFSIFFNKSKSLFVCADDNNINALIKNLVNKQVQTFGFSKGDLIITNPRSDENHSYFNLYYHKKDLGEFTISLFGKQNISNASGVILTLINLGFSTDKIRQAIVNFTGAKRRFEKIAYLNNIYLFDDYAHHPAEIEATIKAARDRFPQRRIIVIFQPHTYSRTQVLLNEFNTSLNSADIAYVLPIFPSARENKSDFKISSHDINGKNIHIIDTRDKLFSSLKNTLKAGDIVFTLGAGDVYKLNKDIRILIKNIQS